MIKTLFTTEDIVKELESCAYMLGYDLSVIDTIIPQIREENIELYQECKSYSRPRVWTTNIHWVEEGEVQEMIWNQPHNEFLSGMAREWIKKLPN